MIDALSRVKLPRSGERKHHQNAYANGDTPHAQADGAALIQRVFDRAECAKSTDPRGQTKKQPATKADQRNKGCV